MLLETRDTCYWSESCVFSSFYVYLKTKKSLSKNNLKTKNHLIF